MTPTEKPKSAEWVLTEILRLEKVEPPHLFPGMALQLLNGFVSERVQEACLSDKKIEFIGNLVKQARAEAIEQAAKVVGKDAQCLPYCNSDGHEDKCPVVFPDAAILALKDTPPK